MNNYVFVQFLGIRTILVILFAFSVSCFLEAQSRYHIRNKVVVENRGTDLNRLIVVLPVPQSNEYQTVEHLSYNAGEILEIPETGDTYLRILKSGNCLARGSKKEWYYDFEITLYPKKTDFSRITSVFPYDVNSDIYKRNTGRSGDIVDPQNACIREIGDTLWIQSGNVLEYARRCYEYVAAGFSYKNPNTGLHPLSEILAEKGGDCGNLSTVFISLLRYKHIPSRHIVTVRPNGETHVWADFYLQKYGWIPVDVTMKNSDPSGDYFGFCAGDGIVFTKGVALYLETEPEKTSYCPLLQTFGYWYWCKSGNGIIEVSHAIVACPI